MSDRMPGSRRMPKLTPKEYNAVLRQDFVTFLDRCFRHLNPREPLLMSWHIELIAAKLEAVRRGEIRRLIINVPPRNLKSLSGSVAFPAFCLGHDPSAEILCVSNGQDLATKLSVDCRTVMTSDWYREAFGVRLSPHRQTVEEFATTENGSRIATSVGGRMIGRGADLIIIDDPLKPDEAVSEAQRKTVNAWFDGALYSRLNNKEKGAIVLIMQRLHTDDLVGHVMGQEPWDMLALPAIAIKEEGHVIAGAWGTTTKIRHEGEALQSERESLATLERLRAAMGEYNFAGQYQQNPVPQGGGMVKAHWIMRYDPAHAPDTFDKIVISWDTANKASELSDYSVGTVWGMKGKLIHLLSVIRKRMNYPELKKLTRDLKAEWNPSAILIEDKASGTQLIQELRQEGTYCITAVKPTGDKVMRMHAQTGPFEQGRVYLPTQAPWLEAYERELLSFPFSKHDDQVDSTAQALKWIHEEGQEPHFLVYTRMEYRRVHGDAAADAFEEKIRREREMREKR